MKNFKEFGCPEDDGDHLSDDYRRLSANGFKENHALFGIRDEYSHVFESKGFTLDSAETEPTEERTFEVYIQIARVPQNVDDEGHWEVALVVTEPFNGFYTNDGTWPDCCDTIDDCFIVARGYFESGGVLEKGLGKVSIDPDLARFLSPPPSVDRQVSSIGIDLEMDTRCGSKDGSSRTDRA